MAAVTRRAASTPGDDVGGAPLRIAPVKIAPGKILPAKLDADGIEAVNEVRLIGRLSVDPVLRTLPSGDEMVALRVVVRRPEPRRRSGTAPTVAGPTVDTLDCTAWRAGLRSTVSAWRAGDVVEVTGALRRRFSRAGGTPVSRYDIEITSARRMRRVKAVR